MAGIDIIEKFDKQKGRVLACGKTIDKVKFVIVELVSGGTQTFFDYGSDVHIKSDIVAGKMVSIMKVSDHDGVISMV